jgi:branched-chain amino acid transport system permease protein
MIGQAIADGVVDGAIVGLGAIGLTLTMRILRFANFSFAELATFGAYCVVATLSLGVAGEAFGPFSFGWPLLAAFAVAAVLTGGLAVLIDHLVFRALRQRGAGTLTQVFGSFAVALILRNLIHLVWGGDAHYFSRELQIAVEILPGVRLTPDQMFVVAVTGVLVVALASFLRYSRLGTALRGMSENPALASVCGIDIAATTRWAWLLAGALASLSGSFLGLASQVRPEMGFSILLAMFTAAILGGVGSIHGALIGALIVGLAENLSIFFVSPGYKHAVPFVILIAVLVALPNGLFGRRES